MNPEEFKIFLRENKKSVDQASKAFELHSKEFDRKIAKIRLLL